RISCPTRWGPRWRPTPRSLDARAGSAEATPRVRATPPVSPALHDAQPVRPATRPKRGERMTAKSRMKLGMTLPIGVGALGDGKPVAWTTLREIEKQGEEVGFTSVMLPYPLLFRRSPPGNNPMVDMPEGKSRGIWEA